MNRTLARLLALALLAAGLVVGTAATSSATHSSPPPVTATVCWSMDDPDLTNPSSYEWPQTFVVQDDPSATSGATCPAPTGCDPVKYQFDVYTLRDQDDVNHLAYIEAHGIRSPSDDAQLEPHGYSAGIVAGTGKDYNGAAPGCGVRPPPPVVKPKVAHLTVDPFRSCLKQGRLVLIDKREHVAHVTRTHNPSKVRWVVRAAAAKGYLLHKHRDGSGPLVKRIKWVLHVDKGGPCHIPGS